jgi:WD40 repeat protein
MSIKYVRAWWSFRFPALVLLGVLLVAALQLTLPEPEAPRPLVITLEHRYGVSALAFSPDGTTVAVGGGRLAPSAEDQVAELTLWDLASGRTRTLLCGRGASVEALAFQPGGAALVALHADGTVRRWDIATGRGRDARQGRPCSARGALSTDGTAVAWPGRDKTVELWDLAKGTPRAVLPLPACRCWALAPDGRSLAIEAGAGSQEVWLCDTDTGGVELTLQRMNHPAACLAFSPDCRRLAVGTFDGAIEVWDRRTGQRVWSCPGRDGVVWALAFSPDGTALASGEQNGSVSLWDPATGEARTVLGLHASPVSALAFSPDGTRLSSGGADRQVVLWDVRVALRQ